MQGSRIVPNDTRQHVVDFLQEILRTPGRTVPVQVIYTDDWQKDHQALEGCFLQLGVPVSIGYYLYSLLINNRHLIPARIVGM